MLAAMGVYSILIMPLVFGAKGIVPPARQGSRSADFIIEDGKQAVGAA